MHDVRPLGMRTHPAVPLGAPRRPALSHFVERLLVDAHLAGCDACRVYDARIGDVTRAIRSAPLERVPVPSSLPGGRGSRGGQSRGRRASQQPPRSRSSRSSASQRRPDRSAWQDDHALITRCARPARRHERPPDRHRAPRRAGRGGAHAVAAGGLGRSSRSCSRASKTPAACRSSSGEARYAPVVSASAEVDAEGRVARAAEIARGSARTSRPSSTARPRRSGSSPARSRAVADALRGRAGHREPCSPGRSPSPVEGAIPSGSSARPTCSRTTSPVSRSRQKVKEFEFQPGARSSRTSCSWTRSTARCPRPRPRCSRRWPSSR